MAAFDLRYRSFLQPPARSGIGSAKALAGRGAFFLAGFPCGTSDVQVSPSVFFRETRQEAGRSNGSPGASTNVGHIGKIAFQLFLVIVP